MFNLLLSIPILYIYIAIGIAILLIIGLMFLVLTKKKTPVHLLEASYLNDIYQALGRSKNLKSLEMKQQRIQVELISIKAVDQNLLKKTDTPAFLTGKKITLLVKEHTKDVFNYLNEKRKEED